MKGVSPLIASVLLIAITMTLAAILASFVSNYTRDQLTNLPSCVGGNIIFSTSDYPKWETGTIVAVIEAENVDLDTFKFEVLMTSDNVVNSDDALSASIAAGSSGKVQSGALGISVGDVDKIRIIAGNCQGVKTQWTSLR